MQWLNSLLTLFHTPTNAYWSIFRTQLLCYLAANYPLIKAIVIPPHDYKNLIGLTIFFITTLNIFFYPIIIYYFDRWVDQKEGKTYRGYVRKTSTRFLLYVFVQPLSVFILSFVLWDMLFKMSSKKYWSIFKVQFLCYLPMNYPWAKMIIFPTDNYNNAVGATIFIITTINLFFYPFAIYYFEHGINNKKAKTPNSNTTKWHIYPYLIAQPVSVFILLFIFWKEFCKFSRCSRINSSSKK